MPNPQCRKLKEFLLRDIWVQECFEGGAVAVQVQSATKRTPICRGAPSLLPQGAPGGSTATVHTFRLHHWDGLKVAHPELVATTVRSATARGHTPSLSGSRVRTSSSSRSSSSICRTVGGSRGKDGNLELSERSRARSGFRLSRSELRFSRSKKKIPGRKRHCRTVEGSAGTDGSWVLSERSRAGRNSDRPGQN